MAETFRALCGVVYLQVVLVRSRFINTHINLVALLEDMSKDELMSVAEQAYEHRMDICSRVAARHITCCNNRGPLNATGDQQTQSLPVDYLCFDLLLAPVMQTIGIEFTEYDIPCDGDEWVEVRNVQETGRVEHRFPCNADVARKPKMYVTRSNSVWLYVKARRPLAFTYKTMTSVDEKCLETGLCNTLSPGGGADVNEEEEIADGQLYKGHNMIDELEEYREALESQDTEQEPEHDKVKAATIKSSSSQQQQQQHDTALEVQEASASGYNNNTEDGSVYFEDELDNNEKQLVHTEFRLEERPALLALLLIFIFLFIICVIFIAITCVWWRRNFKSYYKEQQAIRHGE